MGYLKRLDTEGFQTALDRIKDAQDAFADSKANIISSTDSLMGVWKGKGKNAFRDAYCVLKVELQDEEDDLQVMYDDLQSIKTSYEEWDADTAAAMEGG